MISYDEALKTIEEYAMLKYLANGKLINQGSLLYYLAGRYKKKIDLETAIEVTEYLVRHGRCTY